MMQVILRGVAVILGAWLLSLAFVTFPLIALGVHGTILSLAAFAGGVLFGSISFTLMRDWIGLARLFR